LSDERPPAEKVLQSDRVYEGRILSLRVDTVELSGGRTAQREVVEHAEVVAIVPVDAAGNVVLVRQYRLPACDFLLEAPAGGVEEGEDVEAAARRELEEETGLRAGRLRRLTGYYVSPGYVTEFIHVFLATDLEQATAGGGDVDEEIAVQRLPLVEAVRMVERGEIRDGKSIIGILLAGRTLGVWA
jgi:ADP-ribose pyrophosphatase